MTEEKSETKSPTLFRNYLSFAGAVIVMAAVASIVLLFVVDLTRGSENPYFGIVTYIFLPAFLILGLLIVVAGMLLERRRRRRSPDSEIPPFPKIDLNVPRQRNIAL